MSEAALFSVDAGELPVSGAALAELLGAVVSRGARFRFRARGFSMFPSILDGDVVTLSPLRGGPARFGEVVAFVHPDTRRLVVHRVIGRRGTCYAVKGDNAFAPDAVVPWADALARVTRVERAGTATSLGLGPERVVIALLSRRGPVFSFLRPLWRVARAVARRWPHG